MITEAQIEHVMKTLGFEYLQALNHLRCRQALGYKLP